VNRPRTRSRRGIKTGNLVLSGIHPIGTPQTGLSPNTGPLAASAWLASLDIIPDSQRWSVEITLPASEQSRFKLDVYSEEWGFSFAYGERVSWIRVTDIRFVHGRDDHDLLAQTPPLRSIHALVAGLERRYDIAFDRDRAAVRTTILGSEPALLAWARGL
jgi:hypothetical protein